LSLAKRCNAASRPRGATRDPEELRRVGEQRLERLRVVRVLYLYEAIERGADLVL
jgi:hypothetical protein